MVLGHLINLLVGCIGTDGKLTTSAKLSKDGVILLEDKKNDDKKKDDKKDDEKKGGPGKDDKTPKGEHSSSVVTTGDDFRPVFWMLLAALSGTAALLLGIRTFRRRW